MANRLLSIVSLIDSQLQSFYIKDLTLNGLCSLESIKGELRPVYYNGKDYMPVSFNERSALSIYHRLISHSESDENEQGFGTNILKRESYNMLMVAMGSQKKISSEIQNITYRLADDLKGFIQTTLSKEQLNALDAQSVLITVNSVNFEKRQVIATELPNAKDNVLSPDTILFSIEYRISANFLQDCKTLECPQGLSNIVTVPAITTNTCATVQKCMEVETEIGRRRFITRRILGYTQPQFAGTTIGGDLEVPFNCTISTINANSDTVNVGGELRYNILKNGTAIASSSIQNGRKTSRGYSTVTLNNVVVNKGDIITFDIIGTASLPANGLTITIETIITSL
jgi:hypothetical protein